MVLLQHGGSLHILLEDSRSERKTKAAIRDQEILQLSSQGWTQVQIAQYLGKTQAWVACRLRFARFLHFADACKFCDSLTERKFRNLWEETSGTEQQRFQQVLTALIGKED